jgi:transcriptional regulator with XRE-family HTH domain
VKKNDRRHPHATAELPATWRSAIAALIKEHRVRQGWTQEEFGHRSGYDPVYINMLERQRRNPSVRALIDLCQALGVCPSAFWAEAERRVGAPGCQNREVAEQPEAPERTP